MDRDIERAKKEVMKKKIAIILILIGLCVPLLALLLTVDDEGYGRSESELLEILISKAKEIGADGLIILGQEKQHEWSTLIAGTFYASYKRIVRGSAIIYVSP